MTLLASTAVAADLSLEARDTVSAVELDQGDSLRFQLRNGQVRTLVLEETSARVLMTNLRQIGKAQRDGGTLYEMRARVRIDGHPVSLVRYVGSQETFAAPYVVNGMRLWLDAVKDALELMSDDHGGKAGCAMTADARFALNDAHDAVAPVPLHPWYPMERPFLDIADVYNGDDPYYGAYQGAECHAGLDVNHAKGAPLFAPVDIDDHFLFNSLAAGDNNNRWRGFHTWPNGDRWTLQSHHIWALLVPPHEPIRAGEHYAAAAGVLVGSNEHSHFIFKTRPPGAEADIPLDAWILVWQMFEQERERSGEIRARIEPFGPARTGVPVRFSSEGSRKGRWGVGWKTSWTFGDGGFSADANPAHVFTRAGIYPVTLTVSDGVDRATATHLITVDGEPVSRPALALSGDEEVTFVRRRPEVRDTYGIPPAFDPHTIRILARWNGEPGRAREVRLENTGGGSLPPASPLEVRYLDGEGWLDAALVRAPSGQKVRVKADPKGLPPGFYSAEVSVGCSGCLNSPQQFRVLLDVRQGGPGREVVVDDADAGFYATPYFWVGHRFRFWKEKGYRDFYRSNGGRIKEGEFARFSPDLRAGRYEVSFVESTPFPPGSAFPVRIRHAGGVERVVAEPGKSRVLGTFAFTEGTEGYVELLTEGSRGQVLADAVRFRAVE